MRKLISIILAMMLWLTAAAQELHPLSPHPEGVAWPTNGWEYGEMPEDAAVLVRPLMEKAMAGKKGEVMGETRSIVIVHRGRIVAEVYREGFTKDTKQVSWSIAKSITNALVGRAVHLGLIDSIDDPMPTPHPEDDPRSKISWRHWLNMTEGLSNNELDRSQGLVGNVTAQMMFGRGKFDVAQFHIDEITVQDEPGKVWKYSTPGYHMIGWALAAMHDIDDMVASLDDEMKEKVRTGFLQELERRALPGDVSNQALGEIKNALARYENMSDADLRALFSLYEFNTSLHYVFQLRFQPEFDSAGTYLGGSNVWASAHDYAKFGYLYLRDGVWEGERLLPEGWVDFSRTRTSGKNINTYGAGFWVTTYGEEPIREQALQTPPWDTFNANGSEGQMISIIPSRDLVIVRLGQMANNTENWNAVFAWSQEIARAFPEVSPEE
jgi:CubicO group peptidase (beta-lactamase class C family)